MGAEYNYMGNFHQAAGDLPLAVAYFEQGNVFAWDNHYSNYRLAKHSAHKDNFDESLYRFYRAYEEK